MDASPSLEMSRQGFAPYVGQPFRPQGGEVVLTLDGIEAGPPGPAGAREPFSLIFSSPKPGPVLAEGLHPFTTPGGVACTLYVMPVHTPEPDRQDYQAVFD